MHRSGPILSDRAFAQLKAGFTFQSYRGATGVPGSPRAGTAMPLRRLLPLLAFALFFARTCLAQKDALDASIARRAEADWQAAMQLWNWAEPGYQETKSSALLAEMLEKAGFTIERSVAGIPTAFTATFGEGTPVIGMLGEFDALPGMSQDAVPERHPIEPGGYGHACGHHLFGVASASAAITIAEQLKAGTIKGTIRYYGCPAEEGGSAKVFMVQAGLFADCDAVLHWHPSSENAAGDRSTMARMAVKFRFRGKPAHAAGAPEIGRSALDGVELTNHAAQLLREHTPEGTRIHHVITDGGEAPNIVPEFAEVYYYVRHPDAEVVRQVYDRLLLCAKAGALATETELDVKFEGGVLNMLPNNTLAAITLGNLKALNNLTYTEDEKQFALKLQSTLDSPVPLDSIAQVEDRGGTLSNGSTDVGDVSWVVPTSGFMTACWVPGTAGHSWQAVAAGGTTIGRKGMHLATRVLAATAWDLFATPDHLARAAEEHKQRLGMKQYATLMEPGQQPPLNYRNPPQAD